MSLRKNCEPLLVQEIEILQLGLQEYLDKVVSEVSRITLALGNRFMFFPVIDPAKDATAESDRSSPSELTGSQFQTFVTSD